jgi:hypothetical protein
MLVGGRWATRCGRCTTDSQTGWQDHSPQAGCYRVIGYNLAALAGPASLPAGSGCRKHGPMKTG